MTEPLKKRTAEEIINEFQGTCDSDFTDEELDDINLVNEVEQEIFRCACCHWWCESSDESEKEECIESGERICRDCENDYV